MINNRLAEVFFDKKRKCIEIKGHAYVEASDYKSLKEKHWIEKDTSRLRLVYRNGNYKFRKGCEIEGVRLMTKDIDISQEKITKLDLINI